MYCSYHGGWPSPLPASASAPASGGLLRDLDADIRWAFVRSGSPATTHPDRAVGSFRQGFEASGKQTCLFEAYQGSNVSKQYLKINYNIITTNLWSYVTENISIIDWCSNCSYTQLRKYSWIFLVSTNLTIWINWIKCFQSIMAVFNTGHALLAFCLSRFQFWHKHWKSPTSDKK